MTRAISKRGLLPDRLDVLFGFKAVALSGELSGTDKRVATAILDSFNRHTGQCDPSLKRIAHLVGIERRTVLRSLAKIEAKTGLIIRFRHAGYFQRNSYQPNWARFREIEAEWKALKKTSHYVSPILLMSPSQGQSSRVGGDEAVPQTCSNETCIKRTSPKRLAIQEKVSRAVEKVPIERSALRTTASRQAARDAAERRWNVQLTALLATKPAVYAAAIDAIDIEMQSAATEMELHSAGSGLSHVLNELSRRKVLELGPVACLGEDPCTDGQNKSTDDAGSSHS